MKKYTTFLIAALFAAYAANSQTNSGSAGNLSWNLANGILNITGFDTMPNYSQTNLPPWAVLQGDRNAVVNVVLDSGVRRVGQHAFDTCRNVMTVFSKSKNPPSAHSTSFHDIRSILLLVGSADAYRRASVWKNFGFIFDTASYVLKEEYYSRNTTLEAQLGTCSTTYIWTDNYLPLEVYPTIVASDGSVTVDMGSDFVPLPMQWAEIYDVMGRLMNTYAITERLTEINLAHLPTGKYLMRVDKRAVKLVKM